MSLPQSHVSLCKYSCAVEEKPPTALHAPDDAPDMPQILYKYSRHAPVDAPDMPQIMPKIMPQKMTQTCPRYCPSIIFDILKAPAFQKYSS